MNVFISIFSAPKAGCGQEEYEDSYFPKHGGSLQGELLCFAVTDGASEGMLSGKWAAILARTFCRTFRSNINNFDINTLLEKSYKVWEKWKRRYLREREKKGNPIQWYEEPGLQAGAFSTLLGLALKDSEKQSGEWEAVAVGDTCLFQVRGENLIAKFPIEHSGKFDSHPWLISSNPEKNKEIVKETKKIVGDWFINDQFYIMTDALACWFLREFEAEKSPWIVLRNLGTVNQQRAFENWVEELRLSKQIRNDDITLIHVNVESY